MPRVRVAKAAKASARKSPAVRKPTKKALKPIFARPLASTPAAPAAAVKKPAQESALAAAKKPKQASAPAEAKKPKLVRDSFTIPKGEYAVLGEMKKRSLALGRQVKKSELLRAGLTAIAGLDDRAFVAAIDVVPRIQTGRPKDAKRVGKV